MVKAQGMTSSAHDLTSFLCCFNFNIWLFFFPVTSFLGALKQKEQRRKDPFIYCCILKNSTSWHYHFVFKFTLVFSYFFNCQQMKAAVFFCGAISGLFQYLIPVLNLWLQTTSCSHTLECPDNEWKSLNKRAESDITQENKMYNTFKQWVCSLCRN